MYFEYMIPRLEESGPLMILCIKLTTFVYDYYDNYKKDKKHREPQILELLGYVFMFCGILAGPSPSFQEYIDYNDMSMFKGVDMFNKALVKEQRALMRSKFVNSLFFIALRELCIRVLGDRFYVSSPDYFKIPLLSK